jgi:hypothetical protein
MLYSCKVLEETGGVLPASNGGVCGTQNNVRGREFPEGIFLFFRLNCMERVSAGVSHLGCSAFDDLRALARPPIFGIYQGEKA